MMLSASPHGELATPSFPSAEHRQHAQQAVRMEPQHEHQHQEQHMIEISMEGDGGPAGEPIDERNQHEQHEQLEQYGQQQQGRQHLLLQPLPEPPQQQSHDDKHHFQLPTLPPSGPSLPLLPQPVRSLTLALATAAPPVLEGFYDYPKGQEGVHHEPWIRLFGAVLEPRADGFVPTDHACTRGVSLWTFVLRLLGVQALGWRALDESATWKSIGIRVTKLRKQQEEGSAKVKIAQWIGDHIVWRREFRSRPFDMRVPRPPPLRTAEEVRAADLHPPPLRVKSTFALGITLRDPSDPDVQRALANAVDRIAPGAVPCRMGLVLAEYKRLWDTYEPLPLQPRTQAKAANAAARKKRKQAEAAAATAPAAALAATGTEGVAMKNLPGGQLQEQQARQEQQGQGQDQDQDQEQKHHQLYEPSGREGEVEGGAIMMVEEDGEGAEEEGAVTTVNSTTVGVGGEGGEAEGREGTTLTSTTASHIPPLIQRLPMQLVQQQPQQQQHAYLDGEVPNAMTVEQHNQQQQQQQQEQNHQQHQHHQHQRREEQEERQQLQQHQHQQELASSQDVALHVGSLHLDPPSDTISRTTTTTTMDTQHHHHHEEQDHQQHHHYHHLHPQHQHQHHHHHQQQQQPGYFLQHEQHQQHQQEHHQPGQQDEEDDYMVYQVEGEAPHDGIATLATMAMEAGGAAELEQQHHLQQHQQHQEQHQHQHTFQDEHQEVVAEEGEQHHHTNHIHRQEEDACVASARDLTAVADAEKRGFL
ncbi:hypothetical protein VYU27_001011 [Nannochloropsis oceanica]